MHIVCVVHVCCTYSVCVLYCILCVCCICVVVCCGTCCMLCPVCVSSRMLYVVCATYVTASVVSSVDLCREEAFDPSVVYASAEKVGGRSRQTGQVIPLPPVVMCFLSASLPQFSHLLEEDSRRGPGGRKGPFSKTSEKQQKWEESREVSRRRGRGQRQVGRRGTSRKVKGREMHGKGFFRKRASQRRTKGK